MSSGTSFRLAVLRAGGLRWAPDWHPVMLKAFHLGVVLALLQALAAMILARPTHLDLVLPPNWDSDPYPGEDGGAVRNERSANISHIVGISRKIQIVVNKHMYLQISADGNVNGTDDVMDDYSEYKELKIL